MRNFPVIIRIKNVKSDLLQKALVPNDLLQLVYEVVVLEVTTLRKVKNHLELFGEI